MLHDLHNFEGKAKIIPTINIVAYAILVPYALSRTAIVALWVAILVMYSDKIKKYCAIHRRLVLSLILPLAIIAVCGFYYLKPASANGRLFIWQLAIEGIPTLPWDGIGWDFIEAKYMTLQEQYFATHPNAIEQAKIAGNTNFLFNDFISCVYAYGILGGLVAMGFFVAQFAIAIKHGRREIAAAIGAMTVVMCGSYPLHCWQFIVLCILLALSCVMMLGLYWRIASVVVLLPIILISFTWNRPRDYSHKLAAAVLLYKGGRHQESNSILINYLSHRIADTRVTYLIGENYEALGRLDSAEYYYQKASFRVPSRHYPHYLLMRLYVKNNLDSLAAIQAHYLLTTSPKVESKAIEEMRLEAANYLHKQELASR
jgi:hypothetical protein